MIVNGSAHCPNCGCVVCSESFVQGLAQLITIANDDEPYPGPLEMMFPREFCAKCRRYSIGPCSWCYPPTQTVPWAFQSYKEIPLSQIRNGG